NPAYSIGKKLFEMSGAKLTPLPINPFGAIQLSDWEERLRAAKPSLLYLTTNFQNPTGYSYSSSELARVLELSRELGFGLLEDDWGSDMLSFSELRPTLRSLGGERVLYANSFTKKLLPSLRLGYLLANDETLPSLMASKRVSTLACPTLMEMALFEFLDRGYYDSHLRALHRELDVRYLRALEVLREYLPAEVRFTTPGGGPLIWLEFPRGVSLPGLRERLAARRVQIEDPSGVFIGAPHLNGFRVGYAFLSPKDFERGIEILSQEIRKDL
ncbi:MAG: aminotransferase-like domain-containing protein, partial [Bdellovibrionota bacterium]